MISLHSLTDRDHFFPKLWTIISLLIDRTNFYHDSFIVSIVLPKLAKFFSLHSAALKVWKTMNFQFQDSIDEKRDWLWQSDIKTQFKTHGKSRFLKKCPNSEFFEGSLKPKSCLLKKTWKKRRGSLKWQSVWWVNVTNIKNYICYIQIVLSYICQISE